MVMCGCGGSKDPGPSPVTTSAATTTVATTTVPALTINDVAISLSDEINVSFIAAMREGTSDLTARGPMRPYSGLMAVLRFLLPETLYAQQAARAFVAPCRRGGSTTVRYGGFRSRDINLQGVQVVHANCGGTAGSRPFTFNGTMTANGRWRADNPQDPVKITGTVNVNEITAPVAVDCTTGPAICVGQAGGITIGPADRPPPPNPTSTTTSTIRPGTTTTVPGTTTVPATTSVPNSSLNLTGTWTEVVSGSGGSGTQTMILTQTGNSLSGRAIGQAVAGVIQSSSVTGTVSGSSVSMTENDTVTASQGGINVSCQISIRYTLTASSNSRMTGSYTDTGTCTISGLPPGVPVPPVPPVNESGTATFTK
jgi:hypothetical protein